MSGRDAGKKRRIVGAGVVVSASASGFVSLLPEGVPSGLIGLLLGGGAGALLALPAIALVADRPLNKALPMLLLMPLGVAIWLGPRAPATLAATAALCAFALALLAAVFFLPARAQQIARTCPSCGYGITNAGLTRCPNCAVQLPADEASDSSSSVRPTSSSTRPA